MTRMIRVRVIYKIVTRKILTVTFNGAVPVWVGRLGGEGFWVGDYGGGSG